MTTAPYPTVWTGPGWHPQPTPVNVIQTVPTRTEAWRTPPANNNSDLNKSNVSSSTSKLRKCMSKMTAKMALCCMVGFTLAAIPLAVMTTLWVIDHSKLATAATAATSTTTTLPIQCYSYSTINDVSRNLQVNYGCCYSPYDNSLVAGWYRFTGSAGTRLVNSPITTTSTCGSSYPGYFNGSLPTTAGAMTTGNACFYTGSSCGSSTSPISVINCDGYYVFYLVPSPAYNYRYCTAL